MSERNLLTALLVAISLSGCQRPSQEPPGSPAVPAAPATNVPLQPPVTLQDWQAAVASTYTEWDRKNLGDGVSEFYACFGERDEKGKCPGLAFAGKRDAFRKLTHLTPLGTSWQRLAADQYLGSYIALADCQPPSYFLKVQYQRTGGSWLFINKVAVLADGNVVLERDFSDAYNQVERDVLPNAVKEDYHFIASPDQRQALFKLRDSKELAVRITGQKGYVSLKPDQLKTLRADVEAMRLALDKIAAATKGKMPEKCP